MAGEHIKAGTFLLEEDIKASTHSAERCKELGTYEIRKREMSIIASFISVAGLVGAFVVRPQNVWVFVAFYMVSYLGIAMFSMFCWALITDVIALKKKHGEL